MSTTVASRTHQRKLEAQVLAALGDGKPRTAAALAEALFGPGRTGIAVNHQLRVLEAAGAVTQVGAVWVQPHKKYRAIRWQKVPAPAPAPPPPPRRATPPRLAKAPAGLRLEKGITQDDLDWMIQQRENAARKAAWRVTGGGVQRS